MACRTFFLLVMPFSSNSINDTLFCVGAVWVRLLLFQHDGATVHKASTTEMIFQVWCGRQLANTDPWPHSPPTPSRWSQPAGFERASPYHSSLTLVDEWEPIPPVRSLDFFGGKPALMYITQKEFHFEWDLHMSTYFWSCVMFLFFRLFTPSCCSLWKMLLMTSHWCCYSCNFILIFPPICVHFKVSLSKQFTALVMNKAEWSKPQQ